MLTKALLAGEHAGGHGAGAGERVELVAEVAERDVVVLYICEQQDIGSHLAGDVRRDEPRQRGKVLVRGPHPKDVLTLGHAPGRLHRSRPRDNDRIARGIATSARLE